jgi:hypothetical protein
MAAARVIAYLPTDESFALLVRNIARNHYGERITVVNKAIAGSGEVHVSACRYGAVEGFEPKLARVPERLRDAGYALLKDRNIYTATRNA